MNGTFEQLLGRAKGGDRDAAQALKELRAATARKPQEPPQKGGFLGLLKKFKGK